MMEVALRDAKTARLREARLAKEAADLLAHAPGKPRAKAVEGEAAKRIPSAILIRD